MGDMMKWSVLITMGLWPNFKAVITYILKNTGGVIIRFHTSCSQHCFNLYLALAKNLENRVCYLGPFVQVEPKSPIHLVKNLIFSSSFYCFHFPLLLPSLVLLSILGNEIHDSNRCHWQVCGNSARWHLNLGCSLKNEKTKHTHK